MKLKKWCQTIVQDENLDSLLLQFIKRCGIKHRLLYFIQNVLVMADKELNDAEIHFYHGEFYELAFSLITLSSVGFPARSHFGDSQVHREYG